MTTTELKTETQRLANEVEQLYWATHDARVLPQARREIWDAAKNLQYALQDLEATPPTHGRLGQHDVRD